MLWPDNIGRQQLLLCICVIFSAGEGPRARGHWQFSFVSKVHMRKGLGPQISGDYMQERKTAAIVHRRMKKAVLGASTPEGNLARQQGWTDPRFETRTQTLLPGPE
jgi:hypothetical protein